MERGKVEVGRKLTYRKLLDGLPHPPAARTVEDSYLEPWRVWSSVFRNAVKNRFTDDPDGAPVFSIFTIVQQGWKNPPVQQRGWTQNKPEGALKVERWLRMQRHVL
jgi:hypothetical protein